MGGLRGGKGREGKRGETWEGEDYTAPSFGKAKK